MLQTILRLITLSKKIYEFKIRNQAIGHSFNLVYVPDFSDSGH